jgi:hypothetical protein
MSGAAGVRRKRRAAVLLPQPCHRPIEVMQVEAVDPGDPVVLAPAIRRAVGAADEQSVEHGEKTARSRAKPCLR